MVVLLPSICHFANVVSLLVNNNHHYVRCNLTPHHRMAQSYHLPNPPLETCRMKLHSSISSATEKSGAQHKTITVGEAAMASEVPEKAKCRIVTSARSTAAVGVSIRAVCAMEVWCAICVWT